MSSTVKTVWWLSGKWGIWIYVKKLGLFLCRCHKLPRGVKEWPAFFGLKKTIEDFCECCPLLERMSSKAMMPRHWKQITELTEHNFVVEGETLRLKNFMEAPLLKYKEEIEVFRRKRNGCMKLNSVVRKISE